MKIYSLLLTILMLLLPLTALGDPDEILKQIHERQLIIAGKKQGSAKLARKELKALMHRYADEEGKKQLGKALEWLESQGNDLGFETDVKSLYKGFNRYAGRTSVVPLEMTFVELAAIREKYDGIKGTIDDFREHAGRGYSYAKRLYELSGVFSENQEPAAKRLSSNLSLLADAMSNYGDKIPLVGAFIAAYGDITGEMVKAVNNLGEKLNARNPWLNDATYGINELTRAYRHQLPGVWLKPVLGLKDCYISDDGPRRVYIFDPKSRHTDRESGTEYDGAFVPVSQYPPFNAMSAGKTVRELRRRYKMFDQAGIKTPGVRQVLREAGRIVRIAPRIDYGAISAGGGFTVQMLAYHAVDGRPVSRSTDISFVLTQDAGYWGTETQTATLGQFLTWTAPEDPGKYELTVDLSETSKSSGWQLQAAKPVKAPYIVGSATRLSIKPDRVHIATTRRQPLPISVLLQDGNGDPLTTGGLVIDVTPEGQFALQVPGSFLSPRPRLELSDNELKTVTRVDLVPIDSAVMTPGPVHVTARYKDKDKRVAAATAILRVQEPVIIDNSRIAVNPRFGKDSVDLAVTVSDADLRKVRVGTVTLTALNGGLFKTHTGKQTTTRLDLTRSETATWVPGDEGKPGRKFKIVFSGGAWQDALYSPVTTQWTLESVEEEAPLLFAAAPPPAAPAQFEPPADEAQAAEEGYVDEVASDQWQEATAEQLPGKALSGSATVTAKNQPSESGIPATTQAPAPETQTGDLFLGPGHGLGVASTSAAAKPVLPEIPAAPPQSDPADRITGQTPAPDTQSAAASPPNRQTPAVAAALPYAEPFKPVPVNPTARQLDLKTARGYNSPVIQPPIQVPAFAWNEAIPTVKVVPEHIIQWSKAPFPEADLKSGKAERQVGTNRDGSQYRNEKFTISGHKMRRRYKNGQIEEANLTYSDGSQYHQVKFIKNLPPDWGNGVDPSRPETVFGKDVVTDHITVYYVSIKNDQGSESMRYEFDDNGRCLIEDYKSDNLPTDERRWEAGVLVYEKRMMDDGTMVEQLRQKDKTLKRISCYQFFKTTMGRWVKLKHGPWITFHPNGKVQKALVYEKDEENGTTVEWHDTGAIKNLNIKENGETVFHQYGLPDGRLYSQMARVSETKRHLITWALADTSPNIRISEVDIPTGDSHTVTFNQAGLRHGEEYNMKNGQRSGKRIYWKNGVPSK